MKLNFSNIPLDNVSDIFSKYNTDFANNVKFLDCICILYNIVNIKY